jgi:hypothetical protein
VYAENMVHRQQSAVLSKDVQTRPCKKVYAKCMVQALNFARWMDVLNIHRKKVYVVYMVRQANCAQLMDAKIKQFGMVYAELMVQRV